MKGLSKSRYTAFCQCPRMIWLNAYHPELAPVDPSVQTRFEQGNEVGDLAMTLFGDFIDVTTKRPDGSLDLGAMIVLTRKEMEEGREVICEASFSFETMQPVIPIFDGTRPYQQITFQYSLHWLEEPDGELHHTEFLGNSVDDPRRGLAEQLCRDIPREACVTAYNKAFECTRLSELSEAYPDLADHLICIRDNIVDLIDPFRGKMLYRPAMNGSFSIKKVLPALFPDDPELNYTNLEGAVHNGGDAMTAYPAIASMNINEAEATRRALLEYCHLDTLAMVRIYEKLKELAGKLSKKCMNF